MSQTVITIPTYDERNNVRPVTEAIFKACPEVDILFVDDNSPDGTGQVIDALCATDKRIHVIHKPGKAGLGRAYVTAFKWALERDYRLIFGMDCDFSHDPREVPAMIQAAAEADLVIGSRYVGGIRIMNWPFQRLLLSKMAGMYIRLVTGVPVSDPTSGFRCYRRDVLVDLDLDSVASNGYSFLVEMAYRTWVNGFRIKEVPIVFEDRRSGYSKMNTRVFMESVWMVWRLALQNAFRRRPRTRPPKEGVSR